MEGSIIDMLKSGFKLLSLDATEIPAQPPPIINIFECFELFIIIL